MIRLGKHFAFISVFINSGKDDQNMLKLVGESLMKNRTVTV
jgi:hypothetical protein